MTAGVFGLGVAFVSALVLSISVSAYIQLLRAEERLPDFRRRVWLDVLRAVPWGLGLVGGLAMVARQPWAASAVEAAGWALAAVGVVQFAMEVVAQLVLRSGPDGEVMGVPLAQPLIGAAVGLAVILLLAWGLVAGARAV
ncbi:MAG: hypothetical protein AAGI52_16820 [Bacteroidota bacterium]